MDNAPPNNAASRVMAVADGEASLFSASGRMLPEQFAHQAQLRRAVRAAMDDTGACPADLRAMLSALVASGASCAGPLRLATQADAPPAALRFAPKKWHRYVLAAGLLLAVGLGIQVGRIGGHVPGEQAALADDQLADQLIARNALCAEHRELLQRSNLFVTDVREMPAFMLKKFGKLPVFTMDFNGAGYAYKLAGSCSVPGPDSIHTFYENGKGQALSLWIRPADGHIATEPGRVRICMPPLSPKAVASWRDDGGLEYRLVAPSIEELERVLRFAQDSPPAK